MSKVVPFRPRESARNGTIQVLIREDGWWEVVHESSSGSSYSLIERFPPGSKNAAFERAVAEQTGKFGPCELWVQEALG